MHGWVQREGEGSCRSPQRSISWHMHPTVIAADSNSFFKDGRKISVGDCALFKPPQESPPFIGLIRWLTLSKDNNLLLGVNWLYRPAELKLGKGSLLESAPNEIFYSFHKDKIPAASLLHPCKVAFLPRGVELPTGTSSFVCRRIYDIENKCLWWLTDQDYINERQEEVDQLLYKTRTEMHGTPQPGGRSPKQLNGLTPASHLKPGSDNVQNSGTSFPAQVKGKKRDRGDHAADSVKRERSSRTDDGDSCKSESYLKSEIARITEKGGSVDMEGVEKLVQLMQPDRMERKMDLISRSMLVSVIAATEKVECLNRFLQLRGLPVLDEWLQDIHKGKVGGSNSPKDGDRSVEEFLLVLLRALDKLPVNLHALQTCNIGRSVNLLRSHKNVEIHKKARTLVDTWKKRVEAEMISIDAKSGSTQGASVWSSKSNLPESSNGGSEVAVRSSTNQHSASKTTSMKSSHGESNPKSAPSTPGVVKPVSPPASDKESHPVVSVSGTPDLPLTREDRSSSSNQSLSYSQSISGKEEGKSPTAFSASASKMSSSSSRNRKVSSFPGVTGGQKEISSSRSSSAHRSTASDKVSQSALTSEIEGPIIETSNHKLIVKIPNRVQTPTRNVNGVSPEDQSVMRSQASSPVVADKPEQQFDNNAKEKSGEYQCNGTSDVNVYPCQISDRKDMSTGSGVAAGSPAAVVPDDEKSMSTEDSGRSIKGPKKNQLEGGKLRGTSFSPMNALIESCVKHSEAHSSLSLEDDVGMNLLASVATGEMSRSQLVSPTDSTERSTAAVEEVCFDDEAKSKSSPEDHIPGGRSQFPSDDKKQAVLDTSRSEDGLNSPKKEQLALSSDVNFGPVYPDIPVGAGNKPSISADLKSAAEPLSEVNEKSNQQTYNDEKIRAGVTKKEEIQEEKPPTNNGTVDSVSKCRSIGTNAAVTEDKVASSNQSFDDNCHTDGKDVMGTGTNSPHKFAAAAVIQSELAERAKTENLQQTAPRERIMSEACDEVRIGEKDAKSHISDVKSENCDSAVDRNTVVEGHGVAGSCSTTDGRKSHNREAKLEKNEIIANDESARPEFARTDANELESTSTIAEPSSSAAAASYPDAKIKFDLNEGLTVDDGNYGEPISTTESTTFQMNNSLPFSVNSIPSIHPPSITVAAAAKGPFVPPEDLLRSKGELGWKGSAATSAFRPAEPRKVDSMNSTYDASTSKSGRAPLDIDLNEPVERVPEEMPTRDSAVAFGLTSNLVNNRAVLLNETLNSMPIHVSGGLNLDLNRGFEANEKGLCSTSRSSNRNRQGSTVDVKPFLYGLPCGDVQRDFDLNDDASVEHLTLSHQAVKVGLPPQSQLPFAGGSLRINNNNNSNNPGGLANFSSWFPPRNAYPTMSVTPDVYRGSVMSSSSTVPFPSGPFQFPVFPFGPTFPVGATSYGDPSSAPRLLNPQLLGPVGAVSSQFQRPFVVRQGLDLNADPVSVDSEFREDMLLPPPSTSQHSVSGSILKRKEPEGGWDKENFRYKQPSWQ
ncbi:hypothetical protein ABFS83_09G023900 [Erythranthe nasuta]